MFSWTLETYIWTYPVIVRGSVGAVVTTLGAGRSRATIPAGPQDFSPLHNFPTGYGAHPASYLMSTGGLFPRGWSGRGVRLTIECRGSWLALWDLRSSLFTYFAICTGRIRLWRLSTSIRTVLGICNSSVNVFVLLGYGAVSQPRRTPWRFVNSYLLFVAACYPHIHGVICPWRVFRNVSNSLPLDLASYLRRFASSVSLLW